MGISLSGARGPRNLQVKDKKTSEFRKSNFKFEQICRYRREQARSEFVVLRSHEKNWMSHGPHIDIRVYAPPPLIFEGEY